MLQDMQAAGIAMMAYSPIEQGVLTKDSPALDAVARRHGATPVQVALAWVISHPAVLAIPKASSEAHARENAGAAALALTEEDLADLTVAFPEPAADAPIEVL